MLTNEIDPELWDRAVEIANQSMTAEEQSWASEKCGGGPHTNASKLGRPLVRSEAFWEEGIEPSWFCFSD